MSDKFILIWDMKFTLLEKYILKIIKEQEGYSDEKIAEVLLIESEDVKHIIDDRGLNEIVQGDASRRTLRKDFLKQEYAIVDDFDLQRNKANERKNDIEKKDCTQKHLDIISECVEVSFNDLVEYDNIKSLKARKYYKYRKDIEEKLNSLETC